MTDDDKALVSKIRSEAELQKHYDGLLHMQMTLWADRIEALSAENERLRDVLGDLIEAVQRRTADLGGYDGRFGLSKSIVKARAALGDTE